MTINQLMRILSRILGAGREAPVSVEVKINGVLCSFDIELAELRISDQPRFVLIGKDVPYFDHLAPTTPAEPVS